jgi:hypothetical protein
MSNAMRVGLCFSSRMLDVVLAKYITKHPWQMGDSWLHGFKELSILFDSSKLFPLRPKCAV